MLFDEPGSDVIERKLMESRNVISAATMVELGIVIEAKTGPAGTQLLGELMARADIDVVAADRTLASETGAGLLVAGDSALNRSDSLGLDLS